MEELVRGSGVSATALRRGGVATAADVHQRNIQNLDEIRNVGPKSAHKIKSRAAEYARIRPEDLRPPGNPNVWGAADYALLRALGMLTLVTALAPHAAVLQQILVTMRWLAHPTVCASRKD